MGRFSDVLMDHFTWPRNTGEIQSPDCIGIGGTAGQGPVIVLTLRVRDNLVVEAKCKASGCGVTVAAGSILTELILNRRIDECRCITAEQLTEALGGVPPDKLHSPILAVTALRKCCEKLTGSFASGWR